MFPEPLIKTIESKRLAGIKRRMSLINNSTPQLWGSFMPRRKEVTGEMPKDFYSVQVYDSADYFVNFNPAAEFTKWAAVEQGQNALPEGMEELIIPAGQYAVFNYKGRASDAGVFFTELFSRWLPASAFTLDDRPHFELLGEKYKNDDPSSEEEIWIPVKSK